MSGLKARSCCSDGSSLTSTRGSPAGATGKSSSIHSPSGSAPSTPLRVWKRMALVFGTGPACHRTWALARVAWPQRSTSTVGVNQRRSQSPSGRAVMNAVSDRFISRATACIQASSGTASRTHTAAGLPAKGRSVNASTVTIVVKSIGARHHGDEVVLVGGQRHRAVAPAKAAHADALLVEAVFELAAVVPRDAGKSGAGRFDGLVHVGRIDRALVLALLGLLVQRPLDIAEQLGDARRQSV